MTRKAQDDDLIMSLVDLALARPAEERAAYLRGACRGEPELYSQVWHYVEWEQRMNGFLLKPLCPPAAYEHPFEPGQLLDNRFRITREVAQGGMGIVYEALDEKLERRIALKCAKIGFRKRLPPEVRHATEISHPNVCKIYEIHTASTDQGEVDFLTMEFLEGETLAERLDRGPLPLDEPRTVARQLCAGLAAAHHNGVIHGDLKSGNVILTTEASGQTRAVITDFGLARPAHSTALPEERGGTPDYMAPELWKGEEPTAASDVYALGVILYELASGHRLRRPEMSWEERLIWKPPSISPKWDRILGRCLEPDPKRRFQTGDEVAQALAPVHSRSWFLPAAAAAVLAVLTGLVTYQRTTTSPESVRLALLPLGADRSTEAIAEGLFRDAGVQFAHLKGDNRIRLTVIPPGDTLRKAIDTPDKARSVFGATHVLRATLEREKDHLILHAFLTDARSRVNIRDWTARYDAPELRYAPVALAGLVTESLRLPPLNAALTVNAAARRDYLAGLALLEHDTGVDRALPLLERAVQADSDSPLTFAALAEAQWFKYFLTNDKTWLSRASDSEREAELRDPDVAPVHRVLGLLDAHAGRYELAASEYRRAIELEPDDGDAYRRLGQVLEQNNQLDDAVQAYQRSLQVEPSDHRTWQALGAFYYNRANYGEAVKYLAKAVNIAPAEPNLHSALGAAYLDLGRFSQAENELRLSLQLGETPNALHLLGHILMYEGKDQEAVSYITQALSQGSQRYLWWMNLGIAYRRLNLAAKAEQADRRGLELAEKEMAHDPRNGLIRADLAYLCARLGEEQRAESEIAQALQLSPNDADTRWAAAITYEALGQRENTLAVLSASPPGVLADLSRWPDVADLHRDPRFLELLASHPAQ
ncbi:MAG TPA: protein kinase [Bryobacteraceae bacterium]|nr:protein kinase [Bryobacteraceae bacterium]HUO29649.1 protein kinase [Bryobacteraceae bacterium]